MPAKSLNMEGRKQMNERVMKENGREGWNEKSYQSKNKETGNHYDWSRHNLNFEITKGGNIQRLTAPSHLPIEQRLADRYKALGFNYYKEDSKNAPYSCVDIIVGGDHDLMSEIAFGSHTKDIDFSLKHDNAAAIADTEISHYLNTLEDNDDIDSILPWWLLEEDERRGYSNEHYSSHQEPKKPLIVQWALDNYNYFCEKFGEENVVSFSVHLDETTPHAHVLVVPTARKKQRGRVKPGEERKMKEVVSFKAHFGDLTKENSRKAAYRKWHDDYFRNVASKYGFARDGEEEKHSHLTKQELDKYNKLKEQNKQLSEDVRSKKEQLQTLQKNVSDKQEEAETLNISIQGKKGEISTLNGQINQNKDRIHLQVVKYNKNQVFVDRQAARLNDLNTKVAEQQQQFDNLTSDVVRLSTEVSDLKRQRWAYDSLSDEERQLPAKVKDLKKEEQKLQTSIQTKQTKVNELDESLKAATKVINAYNSTNLQWQNNGIIGMLKKLVDLIGEICGGNHNYHNLANNKEATLFYNAIYDPDEDKRLENFDNIWEIAKINFYQGWTDSARRNLRDFAAQDLYAQRQSQEESQSHGLKI